MVRRGSIRRLKLIGNGVERRIVTRLELYQPRSQFPRTEQIESQMVCGSRLRQEKLSLLNPFRLPLCLFIYLSICQKRIPYFLALFLRMSTPKVKIVPHFWEDLEYLSDLNSTS